MDELETVAMLLAEMLAAAGAADGAEEGVGATVPRLFAGDDADARHRDRPGRAARRRARAARRLLADDPDAELARLRRRRPTAMQRGLDELIAARGCPTATAPRARCWKPTGWSPPMPAGCAASPRSIRGGLTAEAAVQRVAGELRDRMRRIADPYLRERLADLEDLAGRLLAALTGDVPRRRRCRRRDPARPPARPGASCWTGTPAASPAS